MGLSTLVEDRNQCRIPVEKDLYMVNALMKVVIFTLSAVVSFHAGNADSFSKF